MCNGSGNHRVASFVENYLWERALLKVEQNSVCFVNGCASDLMTVRGKHTKIFILMYDTIYLYFGKQNQ